QKDDGKRPKDLKHNGDLFTSVHTQVYHQYQQACKVGGLVEMASRIERRFVERRHGNRAHDIEGVIKVMILLSSPQDLEEAYPEVRALIRCAIRNNVILLTTHHALNHWAMYEADGQTQCATNEKVIGLIAHDGKKIEMCRWVVTHRHALRNFDRIITTGTTGALVGDFLEACGIPSDKIDRMYSGPKGGDVQIAEEIINGNVEHVVFFVDPMTSHPHEADIQTLYRICSLPELKINLRITEAGASSWISSYSDNTMEMGSLIEAC
ncbi:MAG: methylglyoxal synthase, partial [Gammaproteobacteria bacterium]